MRPALILLAATLTVSTAHATSFSQRPFPDTVQDAPNIVRGKIGSSNADYGTNSEGTRFLYTFYELQVEEVVKGTSIKPGKIMIRELGGEKSGIGMEIPGASKFDRGEDVVTMLGARNEDGSYDVRGLMMGKLNIVHNESGNDVLSGPALASSPHEEETGAQNGTRTWTLADLRELVRNQAAAAPAPSITPIEKTPSRPTGSPSAAPAPRSSPQPRMTGSLTAPPLQNSAAGESIDAPGGATSGGGYSGWLIALVAALLALPLLGVFLRSRK